jgi:hypothetical protein
MAKPSQNHFFDLVHFIFQKMRERRREQIREKTESAGNHHGEREAGDGNIQCEGFS